MSNIYPIGQTSEYLLARALRNRRAGKYDQAMMLLIRARSQDPANEQIAFEIAQTYDEIDCEQEAVRAYLRVVRMGGAYRAQALFSLALTSAQQGDLQRAVSYFDAYQASDRSGVSPEMAQLLKKQLAQAIEKPKAFTRIQRARVLERRAVERLQAGKIHAALRTVSLALHFHETPQSRLLKACCHLMLEDGNSAVGEAQRALELKRGYVQALCVLVDANMMMGRREEAKRFLIRAIKCANATQSLFSTAVECAKYGFNCGTLILTRRILKRGPYHVRALAMRACAYMNQGSFKQAERIFAKLRAVLPDDSIFEAYYRMAKEETPAEPPLSLAQDVTRDEAINRGMQLISALQEEPASLRSDDEALKMICTNADWALHSLQAGANVTLIAVLILSALDTERTRETLFAALTDPLLDDGLKRTILQAVSEHCSCQPVYADLGGQFLKIAAGTTVKGEYDAVSCQFVVQQAADALMGRYPDAAEKLLDMWAACFEMYGPVSGRHADACAAALECAYHLQAGRSISVERIAGCYGVSKRLTGKYIRRILRAFHKKNSVV